MANQPKKYKKFVATAATATLVASAIVPVASAADFSDIAGNTHADAIKALADQGIVNGYADGTFKPNAEINRGQTVKLLGRWLETQGYKIPDNWNTVQRFNDLPVTAEAELVKYAALVKDAGVFNGSNGNLNYNQPMQRQQMATVLVRAINKVLNVDLVAESKAANFESKIKDLDKVAVDHKDSVVALEYAGITQVENFNPANSVTRGQFASFLYRTIETNAKVNVTAVEATSTTTLTVTGSALKTISAKDITVSDNTVESYTPAENGRTATIKLGTSLVAGEEATVTIAGKEFKVTYKVEAKKASVKETTYDDDTKGQAVALEVDGKQLTGSDLIAAGYDVKFAAFEDKKGLTPATDFFKNDETGVLADNLNDSSVGPIPADGVDVYVTATITKGTEVIVADLGKITIKNIDLATEKINEAKIVGGNGYEKLSNVLVPGETATVNELKIAVDKKEEKVSAGYTLKSSNPAVISVNGNNITAVTPGKATVTITYGTVTKTVDYEVKNATRELASVTVVKEDKVKADRISSITLAGKTATDTVYLKGVDQFGDLVDLTKIDKDNNNVVAKSSDTDVVTVTNPVVDTDNDGIFELAVTAKDKGSAYITFETNKGYKVSSNSFKVNVSENATASTYKLELDKDYLPDDNDDLKLNVADSKDNELKLDLIPYTSEGVKLAKETIANVEAVQSKEVVEASIVAGSVIVKAKNAGTATIKVTFNGKVYTQTVTVVDEPTKIQSVQFKSLAKATYVKEYSFKDVFTYTESANDTILKGVTVTPASAQQVRIEEATGLIYLDKNGDGKYISTDDEKLGTFGIVFVPEKGTAGAETLTHTTAVGDEGTLIFKITDEDDNVVASTSVKVDI